MKLTQISDGLRFPEGPIALADGSVLVVEVAAGCLSRIRDGQRSVVAQLGGGPNGAAIGPDGRCYVCNNGGFRWTERDGKLLPSLTADDYQGGRIEAVDLATGAFEVLYRACGDVPLNGPNDIVFDAHGGFWFTDHGHAHRRSRDRGAVYYAQADGSGIRQAIFPLETPNGIGLSPDGRTLYVSESITARLWAFDITAPGTVGRGTRNIVGGVGRLVAGLGGFHLFDSLAVDIHGNIHVATVPTGITVIAPDGQLLDTIALPDPFSTNLCFAGPERKTVYATQSSTGRLVSFEGTRAGLELNHHA